MTPNNPSKEMNLNDLDRWMVSGRIGKDKRIYVLGFVKSMLDTLAEKARQTLIEDLCKAFCYYCASGKYELHQDRYHTHPGVNPSWENWRCAGESIREKYATLRTRNERKGEI